MTKDDFNERIESFPNMKVDNLFLEVPPPTQDQSDWFRAFVADLTIRYHLPYPWTYLTPDGEIFAQWHLSYGVECVVDFKLEEIDVDIYDENEESVFGVVYSLLDPDLNDKVGSLVSRYK